MRRYWLQISLLSRRGYAQTRERSELRRSGPFWGAAPIGGEWQREDISESFGCG
jgi:hypothetical protein